MARLSDLYGFGRSGRYTPESSDQQDEERVRRQLRLETMLSALAASQRTDGQGGSAALLAAVEGRQRERETLDQMRQQREREAWRQEQIRQEQAQRAQEEADRAARQAAIEERRKAAEAIHAQINANPETTAEERAIAAAYLAEGNASALGAINRDAAERQRAKIKAEDPLLQAYEANQRRQSMIEEAQLRRDVNQIVNPPEPKEGPQPVRIESNGVTYLVDPRTGRRVGVADVPKEQGRTYSSRERATKDILDSWDRMNPSEKMLAAGNEGEVPYLTKKIEERARLLDALQPASSSSQASGSDADVAVMEADLRRLDPSVASGLVTAKKTHSPEEYRQIVASALAEAKANVNRRR